MTIHLSQALETRLRAEKVAWLTAVGREGKPYPTPVWFLWDGRSFLIYSEPQALKIRAIRSNPHVALHLNTDEWGSKVVVFWGKATIEQEGPSALQVPEYLAKYREGLADLGMTPEQMAADYSAAIRVVLDRVRDE